MDNWVELAQKLPEQDRRTKAPLIRQVKDLDKRIHPLEELERALWADLGMLGPVDSGDLFKLYQSRARADPSPIGLPFSHLQNLDTLHYLREDKSHLLRDILLTLGPALVKYNKVHTKQTVSSQNYSSQAKLGNRIWAVLIGINKYSSPDAGLYNLKGSAADAKRFQTYLTSKLSVPNSHIKLLVNGEPSILHRFTDDIIAPTRVNILHELWNLRDDHCIQRGDVMVIFYSGHGAKYDARDYFTCIDGADVIEAICPSDRGSRRGAHGVVPDISDRELNTILGAIRDAKGDNILFIADCCHAGGMTRAPVDMRQRGLRPLLPASLGDMLQEADNDRRRPAYTRPVSQPGWIADMSSHVLIAACENFEQALEVSAEERGIFTSALVQALESPLGMDPRTTFKSLIESGVRPMLHNIQIPTVVGDRKKCLLWFRD
ncbi:caspase domain-containing protein [Amylostereum chailletii]|nr:caspase domain-containing protein [Amylostereum chailletii]